MEELIQATFNLIKDHREEENFMTIDRIKRWIDQFPEGDRVFLLEELNQILKQRYISKEMGRQHIKNIILFLIDKYKFKDVQEFLSKTYFIDNQSEGKSQKKLLLFLEEILNEDYGLSLADTNGDNPSYVIYLDDILCTGETIIRSLTDKDTGWFNIIRPDGKSNYDNYIESKATLVLAYLAVHKYCTSKFPGRLYHTLGKKKTGDILYVWEDQFAIDNDISNANSSLNFLFPIEAGLDDQAKDCSAQIEKKVKDKGYHKDQLFNYRQADKPQQEKLFTSSANRERFEKIILAKSIEYYNIALQNNFRARPLGYGLYTDLSFGFGTMIFTWRNVPFNTPLVFWYPYHGCTPLFERIFT